MQASLPATEERQDLKPLGKPWLGCGCTYTTKTFQVFCIFLFQHSKSYILMASSMSLYNLIHKACLPAVWVHLPLQPHSKIKLPPKTQQSDIPSVLSRPVKVACSLVQHAHRIHISSTALELSATARRTASTWLHELGVWVDQDDNQLPIQRSQFWLNHCGKQGKVRVAHCWVSLCSFFSNHLFFSRCYTPFICHKSCSISGAVYVEGILSSSFHNPHPLLQVTISSRTWW